MNGGVVEILREVIKQFEKSPFCNINIKIKITSEYS